MPFTYTAVFASRTVGSRGALAVQGSRARERCGESRVSRFAQPFATTHTGLAQSVWNAQNPLLWTAETWKSPNVSFSKDQTVELQVSGEKTDFWDGCGEEALVLGERNSAPTSDDRDRCSR